MSESNLPAVQYTIQFTLLDLEQAFMWQNRHMRDWLQYFALGAICTITCFLVSGFQMFAGLGIFVMVLVVFNRFVILKRHSLSTIKLPMFSEEQQYRFTDKGLEVSSTKFHTSVEWSQFVNWLDGPTSLYLQVGPGQFYILPKRCFTDNQLEDLRNLISSNVIKRVPIGPSKRTKVIVWAAFSLLVLISFLYGLFSVRP